MTFFDWSGASGDGHVSSYLWIYILVTAFFTAGTMGMWYFVVIYRRTITREMDPEKLTGDGNWVVKLYITEAANRSLQYWTSLFRPCCGMM